MITQGRGTFAVALFMLAALVAGARAQTTAPATTSPATTQEAANRSAVVVELHGDIDDANRDALFRRFREARRMGAQTVILDVNTYGGLVTSGLDISRFLKQQDDLHVIAFVGEKAISAGAMIALAADEIVMAPSAKLGDSAPISVGPAGIETLGDAERAKAESPILADFYESAIKNGYDPLLAQAMVSVGRSVYWIENDAGERRFVDGPTYKSIRESLATTGPSGSVNWHLVAGVPNPVDDESSLLTVYTDLATKLGLARETAVSRDVLAARRGLNVVATLTPTGGERLIAFFDMRSVRLVLILIFSASLITAMHAPGHGAPEAIALTALGVLIGIPMMTGYAQWWEVLAVIIGLALLAVEIFVLPGFGVAGITGIVLFLYGLTMTFVGAEPGGFPGNLIPTLRGNRQAFVSALYVVTAGMAGSLFLWFWLNRYLPKLPYFNKLILTTTVGSTGASLTGPGTIATSDDVSPFVGERGEAITDLRPGGSARLDGDGRVTNVISDSGFVKAGAKLIVREVAGNRIVVRPVT